MISAIVRVIITFVDVLAIKSVCSEDETWKTSACKAGLVVCTPSIRAAGAVYATLVARNTLIDIDALRQIR